MNANSFAILSEPTRLRILSELRASECHVGDLVEKLGSTQPTISKHLKVLRDAGFVSCRTDAQRRIYRINSAPFKDLEDWLSPYRELWNEHLDALERHLDLEEN